MSLAQTTSETETVRKVVTAVYLPVELRDQLDALAKEAKTSRSWVLSRIGEGWFSEQKEMLE